MATTQLVRAIHYENALAWQQESKAECSSLRMSWVVVTGENGNGQLRHAVDFGRSLLTPAKSGSL